MAVKDFIISFYAGGPLFEKALQGLVRPALVWQPARPAPKIDPKTKEPSATGNWRGFVAGYGRRISNMFQAAGGSGHDIGRVAIIGFSEGVQGVSEILKGPEASKIDVVLPIDGIHEQYFPAKPLISPLTFEEYISFGMMAAANPMHAPGSHVLAITHSSVRPPFISTTESAQTIWSEVMKKVPGPFEDLTCDDCLAKKNVLDLDAVTFPSAAAPVGMQFDKGQITDHGYCTHREADAKLKQQALTLCYPYFSDGWSIVRVANGLSTFGWAYNTPNRTRDPMGTLDHVFQGQVVAPYMLKQYVVDRWNPACDADALRSGLPRDASGCTMGMGTSFSGGDAPAPLPSVYMGGVAVPVVAQECPAPPPGMIIVGKPGDPCWYTSEHYPLPPPPKPSVADSPFVLNLFAAAAGVGIGWAAYKFLASRKKAL